MIQFNPAYQHTPNLKFIINPIDPNDTALTHWKIQYLAELWTLCHDGINDIGSNSLRHQASRGQCSYCSPHWALCSGYAMLQTQISICKNVLQLWGRKECEEPAEMFLMQRIHMFPVTLQNVSEMQTMMVMVIHPHLACKDTVTSNNKQVCSFLLRFSIHFGNIFGTYPTDFSIKDAFLWFPVAKQCEKDIQLW